MKPRIAWRIHDQIYTQMKTEADCEVKEMTKFYHERKNMFKNKVIHPQECFREYLKNKYGSAAPRTLSRNRDTKEMAYLFSPIKKKFIVIMKGSKQSKKSDNSSKSIKEYEK